jgi:hypothetical protein
VFSNAASGIAARSRLQNSLSLSGR